MEEVKKNGSATEKHNVVKNRREELTENQKVFVDEYLIERNAARAYRSAYPSIKSDEVIYAASSRLLSVVKVKEYIGKRINAMVKRTEITQDMVVEELVKIAYTDRTDLTKVVERIRIVPAYDDDGKKVGNKKELYQTVEIMNTADIPKDKRAAIAGIRQGKYGIEIITYDKGKALELLGRHLGLFTDNINVNADIVVGTCSALQPQQRRLIGEVPNLVKE